MLFLRAPIFYTSIFAVLFMTAGCESKYQSHKRLSKTAPLETFMVAGDLDSLSTCLKRSAIGIPIARKGNSIYIVPETFVIEIRVIQVSAGRLKVEHRADSRTIWGDPYGWDYADMIRECTGS